jgi:hypothetical protein
MRDRLAQLAIILIAVSVVGAGLRWFIEPSAGSGGPTARLAAERQAAERSVPLAYLSLAIAGLALMLDDGWPARSAGGLLTLASGLLVNLPGAFWMLATLVGVALLLAASIAGRIGRGANTT